MSDYILKTFSSNHPISVTKDLTLAIKKQCAVFEIKKQHAQALNTNLLGVHPIHFLKEDYEALFDIVGVPLADFTHTIRLIPNSVVNKDFNVVSDPYNLLTVYLVHCILATKSLTNDDKLSTSVALIKLMTYKFFTSLISSYLKYGADEATMQATIDSLSNRFDIISHGTWKEDITQQATALFSDTSIHIGTFMKFNDDKAILYIISDIQTRIRNKIKIIVIDRYHKMKSMGNKMKSYSLTTEIDGEKFIKELNNSFQSVIENTYSQVLNMNTFIDSTAIKALEDMFTNIRADMFVRLLTKFSALATEQSKAGTADSTRTDRKTKTELYTGTHLLVSELIQKSYRYALVNNVNVKNKLNLLLKIRDVYSASRLNDPDIVKIKKSVYDFVESAQVSTREGTVASLTIGLVVYIIFKTFNFLPTK